MLLKNVPIQLKITILSFGVVIFSILTGGTILISNVEKFKEDELQKRVTITARTVAQMPEVEKHIHEKNGWEKVNPIVERIRIINNVDYIVVLNNLHVRYSHPIDAKLGTVSFGDDESPAFAEHSYTSKAKGELGVAIRAFVPIINADHEQIGVVIVGNLLPSFIEVLAGMKREIFIFIFLTALFGAVGAWLLARHIKDQMFQLEPNEIVRILVERTATFNSMHEGVIAIDKNETITIFNEKAKKMLGIEGEVIGKNIRQVVPDTKLPELISLKHPIYNQEIQVQNKSIMSSRVPIMVNDETVGAVAIFQDRTEVTMMAEELTGVKAFVEALRVHNHEHMNKLHTIAGLIQLGKLEQALNYVFHITEEQEELTRFLSKNIHHDSISGLLLSKVIRGKELDIKVSIDRNSKLESFPPHIDHHDFVLILGNLIENAFTALQATDKTKKEILISIAEHDEICELLIEDNGIGITNDSFKKIFEEGYTTKKEPGHGIGLYLVKNIVEKGNGTIEVVSEAGVGTSIYIIFPME